MEVTKEKLKAVFNAYNRKHLHTKCNLALFYGICRTALETGTLTKSQIRGDWYFCFYDKKNSEFQPQTPNSNSTLWFKQGSNWQVMYLKITTKGVFVDDLV